jgi:thioredoxin 1
MSDALVTVNDAQFQSEVIASQQLVLVDFWATWCAPCIAMEPALKELATKFTGKLKVAKVNIEDNQQTPQAWGVRSVPNFMVFKGGKVVAQFVGAVTKAKLEEAVLKHLG